MTLTDRLIAPLRNTEGRRPARDSDHGHLTRSRRRAALFSGWWVDMTTGKKTRATRPELREAHRLWSIHADIRQGRL
jgi:hypothetical protein